MPAGIADQDGAYPRLLEERRGEGVVAGEHRPSLTAVCRGLQIPDGDPVLRGPR